MLELIPSLISAGLNLLGGMNASDSVSDTNMLNAKLAQQANKRAMRVARMNVSLQKEFARHGIEWKVKDARRMGISPLYALGANTVSYQPVSVGQTTATMSPDTSMGSALANVGQDLGRAASAVMTQSERVYQDQVRALDLQRMGLQNELLKSQIIRERQVTMPPIPSPGNDVGPWAAPLAKAKSQGVTPLQAFGLRWETNPNTSGGQDFENRYGDEGPIAWAAGVPALLADLYRNSLLGRYQYGLWPFKP